MNAETWSRFQFAFTLTFHYLFPQLTMGLALLIVIFKLLGLGGDERMNELARFWGRIFGINFAVGVVTGVPMEFQFGTNWARFSRYSGGVIGLTLAMEGMFAFFAESAFLGIFLFGEKRVGQRLHLLSALMLFVGSWLSGYFIIVTNAFMQHPVGQQVGADGNLQLADLGAYLLNPWAMWQYAHNMVASVVTSCFAVAAVAAYWRLMDLHAAHAERALRVSVVAGFLSCGLLVFPTGDQHGKLVARYQPAALAAMEGKFESGSRADLAIIGQPDVARQLIANPIAVPGLLSFLAYGSFRDEVRGLDDFPRALWPDNVELLYFAYHIMVGVGTLILALMALATLLLWRGVLFDARWMLWALMLALPFPYIATTAGWATAELGRQPWLVYGLLKTSEGTSSAVDAGSIAFTTLGYMGLYLVIGILFLYLVVRVLSRGPDPQLWPHDSPAGH